ncbi:hypothetical protein ACFYZI_40770 [Streptomyces griseorubiginosus]|uniref:hypothetical protein n=1 Tax=Streptomyces griseorubiginosus TaxID=67304 RepID=UPI00369CDFBC
MTTDDRIHCQKPGPRRRWLFPSAIATLALLAGGLMVKGYVSEGSLIITALIGAVGAAAKSSTRDQ